MDFEERFERKMNFIVETLADVSMRQQEAAVRAQAAERRLEKNEESLEKLTQEVRNYVRVGLRLFLKQDNGMKELRKEMRELAAAQKKTEALFQRWISGQTGANGKRPSK